jgi:RNA polymerase sigma-70 factor, ECF subfamily
METTEQEILERAKSGDELAFRTIIEKYENRIAATITGILGSSADVDDIGQETFVRFYRSIHRFRGDSSIGTYLTRIAINLSLNELKRRKRAERLRPEDMPGDPPAGSRSGGGDRAADARVVVQRGLRMLDPKFRTVIVLRLMDGYSTRETADMLRLPLGTVLSRLARGQARMKEILEEIGDPGDGYKEERREEEEGGGDGCG